MVESNGKDLHTFNIIKNRGDPNTAYTVTGHEVTKKDLVIIPSPFDGTMISLRCADYHEEHFVYIDPLFDKEIPEKDVRSYWFAMCTCGAPAGIIGGADVAKHDNLPPTTKIENMLVCQFYYQTLLLHGFGYHANQDQREWR